MNKYPPRRVQAEPPPAFPLKADFGVKNTRFFSMSRFLGERAGFSSRGPNSANKSFFSRPLYKNA